mmetsp:Transcript_42537/g.104768  ORF Transcript_42537/g.104768 Transcript_42537/m.104768 type:complete len:337 (-) Transcript_42537:400-1410(-)
MRRSRASRSSSTLSCSECWSECWPECCATARTSLTPPPFPAPSAASPSARSSAGCESLRSMIAAVLLSAWPCVLLRPAESFACVRLSAMAARTCSSSSAAECTEGCSGFERRLALSAACSCSSSETSLPAWGRVARLASRASCSSASALASALDVAMAACNSFSDWSKPPVPDAPPLRLTCARSASTCVLSGSCAKTPAASTRACAACPFAAPLPTPPAPGGRVARVLAKKDSMPVCMCFAGLPPAAPGLPLPSTGALSRTSTSPSCACTPDLLTTSTMRCERGATLIPRAAKAPHLAGQRNPPRELGCGGCGMLRAASRAASVAAREAACSETRV